MRIILALILGILPSCCGMLTPLAARDIGQWEQTDPAIREWFKGLKQPDNPNVSCCGEADAYWADSYELDKATGGYIAIITDERDDVRLGRPHIAPGTRVPIPKHKIKWNQGNPTGHGILFIGLGGVYCYLPPGGV